jgi:hypothetical protein
MVAGVAVRDEPEWAQRGRLDGERAIRRRMSGTRAEHLPTDDFTTKRACEFAEAEGLIVTSVSRLACGLIVHLETHRMPGAAALRLGLSAVNHQSRVSRLVRLSSLAPKRARAHLSAR